MNEKNLTSTVKDFIQVDSEVVENISSLIDEKATKSLLNIFASLHPADIAEIINRLDLTHALFAFRLLDSETAGDVITEIDENFRERILENVDTKRLANIINELDTDDATDIISDLPNPVADQILRVIDKEYSRDVRELMKYPEDTAGGIMSRDFVSVADDQNVAQAIEEVRKNGENIDHIYFIYVLGQRGKLCGIVPLKRLLINPMQTKVNTLYEENLIYVYPEVDQEEVANLMEKYDLVSIPVVDSQTKMLGRITIDDIVDVIQEEAAEDIQKIAGIIEEEEYNDSAFRISKLRLPWLLVALAGQIINAVVLSGYERSLEEIIVASFFIPIIMAMGGSTSTQAAIVMVRGLSTKEIWLSDSIRKVFKEFKVSLITGFTSGVLLLIATYFIFTDVSFYFSLTLSSTLVIIMIFASMMGTIIPILITKAGADPALATGPLVTTINDVMSLLIYMIIITILFVN